MIHATPHEIKTQNLPVKLTQEEIKERGKQLAKTLAEKQVQEAERKHANDVFKGKISALESRAEDLARVVNNGIEYREVEVFEEPNLSDGVMRIYRRDTGELVDTKTLNQEEIRRLAQRELQLERHEQAALDLPPGTKVSVTLAPIPTPEPVR